MEQDTDLQALRRFVLDSQDLHQLERKLNRFNVFEVLRSGHQELRHSNMMAWLLNPAESHGMGEAFLRRWLMEVHDQAEAEDLTERLALDPVELDATPFQKVRVFREWNHIDLMLEIRTGDGDLWVVVIENKFHSSQHSDQLKRYREVVEQDYHMAHKRAYLFLTLHEEAPQDSHYLPTNYEVVESALAHCINEYEERIPQGPRYLIDQYRTILKERYMEKTETVKLAHRIYWAHRKAVDYLLANIPDEKEEAAKLLRTRIEEKGSTLGIKAIGDKRGEVFLLPNAWDMACNQTPDKNGGTWPKVYCFLRFHDLEQVTLRAMAGPEATDGGAWRDELRLLANKENFKPSQKHSTPPQWFTFAIMKLSLPDTEGYDATSMRDMLWNVVERAVRSEEFTNMVEKVAERIAQLPVDEGRE